MTSDTSDTRIITARRAYEFRQDQIRLSAISVPAMQDYIRQHFNFQLVALGTPQPTFGDVPVTLPPGIVFNFGTVPAGKDGVAEPTMIRFLHFEARRIVIDVAAPSSAIDTIFAHLTSMLSSARTPDGTPIIGTPDHIRDYSEITRHTPYKAEVLIPPELREVVSHTLGMDADSGRSILAPSMRIVSVAPDREYAGSGVMPPDLSSFVYELRSGTRPDEQVYFSAAPLATDAHLQYIEHLEAIFAAPVAQRVGS